MVMKLTNATPIISAAAVDDVRFGLRIAFSRASVPAMPLTRGSGHPIILLIGRATTGPRIATPTNTSGAPSASIAAPAPPNSPAPIATAPSRPTAEPMSMRRRLLPDESRATSRIAAIGGTFAALRAGKTAEATLTPRPAAIEMTTVLLVSTMPPDGMSSPIVPRSALSADATPMPATMPASEAISPTATASTKTEPRT